MRLFGRVIKAMITNDKTGKQFTIDSKDNLRIAINATKDNDSKPNTATLKLYNLNKDTRSALSANGLSVAVSVGYLDGYNVIFTGNIVHYTLKRENLDSIFEITVGDGHNDYVNSFMAKSFKSSSTHNDVINEAQRTMSNTKQGKLTQSVKAQNVRGRTVFAPTRKVLDDMSKYHNLNWSIQDGSLMVLSDMEALTNHVVIVDDSLLIDPIEEQIDDKQTSYLIHTRVNPFYRINGVVKIDNSKIVRSYREDEGKKKQHKTSSNKDGQYKIIKIQYDCDTHSDSFDCKVSVVNI